MVESMLLLKKIACLRTEYISHAADGCSGASQPYNKPVQPTTRLRLMAADCPFR